MTLRCATCRFFERVAEATQPEGADASLAGGRCHRSAPRPEDPYAPGWPLVFIHDYCAEHSEAPPTRRELVLAALGGRNATEAQVLAVADEVLRRWGA